MLTTKGYVQETHQQFLTIQKNIIIAPTKQTAIYIKASVTSPSTWLGYIGRPGGHTHVSRGTLVLRFTEQVAKRLPLWYSSIESHGASGQKAALVRMLLL